MKLTTDTRALLCAALGLASSLVEAKATTNCNTVLASTSAANVQTYTTTTSSTSTVTKTVKVTGTGTTTVTGKAKSVTSTTTATNTATTTVSSNDYGALVTVQPSPGFTAMAEEILGSTMSAAYPMQFVTASGQTAKNRRRHWERNQMQERQDSATSYPATVYCTVVNVLTTSTTSTSTLAAKTITAAGGTSTVTTTATSTTTSTTNVAFVAPAATSYAGCAFDNLVETVSGQSFTGFQPTVNVYEISNAQNHLDCCTKCMDDRECAGWRWWVSGNFQQCVGMINGNDHCDPGYVGGNFTTGANGVYAVMGNGNCGKWVAA